MHSRDSRHLRQSVSSMRRVRVELASDCAASWGAVVAIRAFARSIVEASRVGPRSMTTRTASFFILGVAIVDQAQAQRQPPTQPAVVIVSIGGEEISMHARYPELRLLDVSSSMAGGFFEPLAEAARSGNDDAAHVLYDSLDTCKSFPKSRAEFDATIEKGRKSFAETGSAPTDGPPLVPGMDWHEWSQNVEAFFRKCEGVTDDMYTTATELVRESVGRGSDENRYFYAQAIATTAPQESHAQYEILWRKGSISGLKGLGRDSLPHRIAAIVADCTLWGQTDWRDQLLSKLEASMSPNAFQDASKEAAQILKSPNCCLLDE
jgi:hypothetical protein